MRRIRTSHYERSPFSQTPAKGACIAGLIGEEFPAVRRAGEQRRRDCDVCDVAWARAESERTTCAVDQGMDLGGAPAAGATDRLYCALDARARRRRAGSRGRQCGADSGDRHLEAAHCFRKAARLDELGEYHLRVQVRHRPSQLWKCYSRLCRLTNYDAFAYSTLRYIDDWSSK
jgi:hypothetical protein